eukprot:6459864-Amphidinium_carterae.1
MVNARIIELTKSACCQIAATCTVGEGLCDLMNTQLQRFGRAASHGVFAAAMPFPSCLLLHLFPHPPRRLNGRAGALLALGLGTHLAVPVVPLLRKARPLSHFPEPPPKSKGLSPFVNVFRAIMEVKWDLGSSGKGNKYLVA